MHSERYFHVGPDPFLEDGELEIIDEDFDYCDDLDYFNEEFDVESQEEEE
jgi:hypothetical protein